MLNCIYQDIVVEKVSQEFSPSGISETFLEMTIIIKHLDPLSDYRPTHLVFLFRSKSMLFLTLSKYP